MRGLLWLTWRQHRVSLVSTAVLVLFATWVLVESDMTRAAEESVPLPVFYAQLVQVAFGALVGLFWGAPVVAREFEERTYLVAWGQDVSPERWLAGRVVVLGTAAAVLAVFMGLGDGYRGQQGESWDLFEANPLVQIGYVLFGLAAGVLMSALVRHTLTAMAFTLAIYVGVRLVMSLGARDHYLPTERWTRPIGEGVTVEKGAEIVETGFLDASGAVLSVPDECNQFLRTAACMRARGGTQSYADFQPIDRIAFFQVAEFLAFTAMAAVLFAVAFLRLRRGWRPSRSHRKLVTV